MLAAVLALALATGPAAASSAKGPTAALAPLRWVGEGQPTAEAIVRERLAEDLEDPAITWVPAEDVEAASTTACEDVECHKRLGARVSAAVIVVPTVTLRDRVYEVSLEAVDVASGKVVAQAQEFCEICGVDDVGALVTDQATAFRPRIVAALLGPPQLRIDSDPSGATVFVDGDERGVTPLTTEVTAGRHLVRIALGGRVPQEREMLAVEGETEELRIELPTEAAASTKTARPTPSTAPTGPVDAPHDDRRRLRLGLGGAAIAAGAVALGVGLPLAALHGKQDQRRCTGEDVDVNGTCRYTWATRPVGVPLIVGGVGLLATGIALVTVTVRRDKADKTARRLELNPTLGGVSLRGRF